MGKCPDLTPRKKAKIEVYLKESLLAHKAVSDKRGVSVRTIGRLNQKIKQNLSWSPKRKGNCGRKRMSNERQDRNLVRLCKQNRKLSSPELRKELELTGLHLSSHTVRRRLIENDLRAYRPREKAKLTKSMIRKRKAWAHKVKDMDWSKVAFSDESTFQTVNDRCRYVRRGKGEEHCFKTAFLKK